MILIRNVEELKAHLLNRVRMLEAQLKADGSVSTFGRLRGLQEAIECVEALQSYEEEPKEVDDPSENRTYLDD